MGYRTVPQYKDYVLFMLFIKYISDQYGDSDDFAPPVTIPKGASFKDMIALKGRATSGTRSTPRSSSHSSTPTPVLPALLADPDRSAPSSLRATPANPSVHAGANCRNRYRKLDGPAESSPDRHPSAGHQLRVPIRGRNVLAAQHGPILRTIGAGAVRVTKWLTSTRDAYEISPSNKKGLQPKRVTL